MKRNALILALLLCLTPASWAEMKRGAVVYYKSGCDYMIIATSPYDYSLAQHYSGSDPNQGDQIVGEIKSYGTKDIYNLTRDNNFTVYINDTMESETSVVRKYQEKCH